MFLRELQENVQLLVERTESEILHNDRTLQHNSDLVVNLSHEREELRREVEAEEKMMERLTEILNTVEMCVCVCVCVCACTRACVRACVCACDMNASSLKLQTAARMWEQLAHL